MSPCPAGMRSSAARAAATPCTTSASLNGTYVNRERDRRRPAVRRRRGADRQVPARVPDRRRPRRRRSARVTGATARARRPPRQPRHAHHRRRPRPPQGRLPGPHDQQDPLPGGRGPGPARAHPVGLPQVLRGRRRRGCATCSPQQRDHYLPLRVIKEQLEAIDRGLCRRRPAPASPRVRACRIAADRGQRADRRALPPGAGGDAALARGAAQRGRPAQPTSSPSSSSSG